MIEEKKLKRLLAESEKRSKTYNKMIKESERNFRELNSQNMQGTLIQIEDLFDSNHLYAHKNWIDGVLYDGPNVKRYWVETTLKYPYEKMPDPRGGVRLSKMGIKVSYRESTEWVPVKVEGPDDLDPRTRKPKEEERRVWLVDLRIPRRFVEDVIEDEPEEAITPSKPEKAPPEEADIEGAETDEELELDVEGEEL